MIMLSKVILIALHASMLACMPGQAWPGLGSRLYDSACKECTHVRGADE